MHLRVVPHLQMQRNFVTLHFKPISGLTTFPHNNTMQEKIIILDFGSQTTQLIGRRVRELNTYCEIVPYNKFPHDDQSVIGVILSGSPSAFDSIIAAVQSGKADFGAAGMTVTEDRLASVDFSDTYAEAKQVIIVKEGSEVKSADDLAGKTVGVQLGTTGDILADEIEDGTVERYNKGAEAVMALVQDKIDAVIIDNEPAKVFVAENEGLVTIDDAYEKEEYAIALDKGNTELLEKINASIKNLKDSGKLQEIIDSYISAE